MTKTFTQNELIRYVYDELDNNAKAILEASLITDQHLAEECAELLLTKASLEGLEKGPSKKSLSAIFNYSRNLSLQL